MTGVPVRPSGRRRMADLPPLHLITDDAVLARDDFVPRAVELLREGRARVALHLRGPRTPGGRLERMAGALAEVRRSSGAWLVVNDRVDVAAVVGADGVQLGARSLAVAVARRLAPERAVGASVHGPDEARAAGDADWLVAGTVYATPSHPGRPGTGAAGLRAVVDATPRPVLAIGGVTPDRVAELRTAGAAGVAVLRGVWDARDPIAALLSYLSAWTTP